MHNQGSQKNGGNTLRTSFIKNGLEIVVALTEKDTKLEG